MATEKLFDYNSSFGVLRTNPRLTGNLKVTLDSSGGVWLNSMDVSPELSNQKYKKFRVTGQNTYANDIYNFFDGGKTPRDVVFQVGSFTSGASQPAENFNLQYDFFYGAGASTLIDRNYDEDFKYFQPLWIKDVLPEFFVVFKIPQPLSYPYPTNATTLVDGTQYKVIQDSGSDETFLVRYWNAETGSFDTYVDGDFFYGNTIYSTYTVLQGSGVVTEMDELKYYDEVNDVETYFNTKVLPYAQVIATFDLRSNTTIGSYIRSLTNNPGFKESPITFTVEPNGFTYFNGVSIEEGVLTQKGELLNRYFTSSGSSSQIDFEEYMTDGFSRNGIICPNLLNMEFLFDDPDSSLYSINRYIGFYVSRNDLGEFRLSGQYFWENRNDPDNLNLPKPIRNNLGYYYNPNRDFQSSTGGVRLYYEGASGWMPGSEDVNVLDPQKLYYVTDKLDNFYSLSRYENYVKPEFSTAEGTWVDNTPDYLKFGPYRPNLKDVAKAYSVFDGEQYEYVNIITSGDHGYEEGSLVTITGSSDQINGPWRITIPSGATGNSFQIPIVLQAGTGIVTGSTGYILGSKVNYVDPSVYPSQEASGSLIQGTTGSTEYETGSLVIGDTKVDLLDFTGPDEKIGSFDGKITGEKGRAYTNITFVKTLDLDKPVTFKIFWPNGSRGDLNSKYDLVISGDYAGTLSGWTSGSHYSTGDEFYFNWSQGTTLQIAQAFGGAVSDISTVVWDTASSQNLVTGSDSIIRIKNPGSKQNTQYSISVFSDYPDFESRFRGTWNNKSVYSVGEIVVYSNSYYETSNSIPLNVYGTNLPPGESDDWAPYYPFSFPGYVSIGGVDASQISSVQNFVGGTNSEKNRVVFSQDQAGNIVPGNWIQVEAGRGITGGMSMIYSVTKFVDFPVYDNDPLSTTGTVTGFKGYQEYLVATLSDSTAVINLGSNSSFNVYSMSKLYSGVFTFFDTKTLDFDFWSSVYGTTPTPEYHRYFQLISGQPGQLVPGVKYYVKSGQVQIESGSFNQKTINQGEVFISLSKTSFVDLLLNNKPAIVIPAVFTRIGYVTAANWTSGPIYNYGPEVPSEQDLNSFDGFYGIQSLSPEEIIDPNVKSTLFEYGKLQSEYQYLEENYTVTRANKSRIVPYINKWAYNGGTDSRGNPYRMNVSPAFTPTNFSPGFQQDVPSPQYFTHEWMLLEGVPRQFPVSSISDQNSYLPGKIDLEKIRNASPSESSYFESYFTVDPLTYSPPYADRKNSIKELFTPFRYNPGTGFYDTVFRGVKISLKRRSTLPNPQSDLEKYVPNYRGFQDYKFAAILRVVPEDSSAIQPPVRYEIIENIPQKCVLFVTYAVIKDYRALPLEYTGSTGGDPYLDYLLMYSLSSKKKTTDLGKAALPPDGVTGASGPTGSPLYQIDDIKLSAALDLSFGSGSICSPFGSGQAYILPNPDYDTDLREEINLFYPEGSTESFPATGAATGTFTAIAGATSTSYYPWPTGRAQNLVNFGPTDPNNYYFEIPFAPSNPVTSIPLGTRGAYINRPVTQIGGGENYFDFILKRLSLSYIADKVNTDSPYIKYITYDYSTEGGITISTPNYFELDFLQPSSIYKPTGLYPIKSYVGPQTLGQNQPTGYEIVDNGINSASDILRYMGGYEPLFKKTIMFKNDKDDGISGSTEFDLSYRNCTFAPEKTGFGLISNLSYTKVSLGKNILSDSRGTVSQSAEVYPLIGQTPISIKDFSIFQSTWDPGYYNLYTSSTQQTPVAGTRSMTELKTFMGSKMMQTPQQITTYTFITLEISRTAGVVDPQIINSQAREATSRIQSMTPSQSNTGIGQLGPALSGVDLSKLDESIYPDVEVFWQLDSTTNRVYGVIRLDRILRRYLLNSGIDGVFVESIITEYGVGDPNNIQDDVRSYIEQNIFPIFEGKQLDLLVLKSGNPLTATQKLVRGDLVSPDKIKYGYIPEPNFTLTFRTSLTYSFEYQLDPKQNYSLTFNFTTGKI